MILLGLCFLDQGKLGFHKILKEYHQFKMETIKDILAAIVPTCFMMIANVQDALLVVSISQ